MIIRILILLIVGLTQLTVLSQETIKVKSYIRKIQIDDSVIILDRYLSEETWDLKQNKLFYSQYGITIDSNYLNHLSFYFKDEKSGYEINGWVKNGDTSITRYYLDSTSKKYYIYSNDTVVFQDEFIGKLLVKRLCLENCENSYYYFYNLSGRLDSLHSRTQKKYFGTNTNYYFKYDSKDRLTHHYEISDRNKEYNLDNGGISYEYWKEYNDEKNAIKTINSKQRTPDDFYEDDEIIFSSQNVPLLRIITNITDGIKTIYTIEYEKVK